MEQNHLKNIKWKGSEKKHGAEEKQGQDKKRREVMKGRGKEEKVKMVFQCNVICLHHPWCTVTLTVILQKQELPRAVTHIKMITRSSTEHTVHVENCLWSSYP